MAEWEGFNLALVATDDHQPEPAPGPQTDTLPVNLPAWMVRTLRDLCKTAGIEGGHEAYIADLLSSDLEHAAESKPGFFDGTLDIMVKFLASQNPCRLCPMGHGSIINRMREG